MKSNAPSRNRWFASFTLLYAVFTFGVGLLLPTGAHADTIVAQAAGNITAGATWTGGAAPTAGDANTWQSGAFILTHATAGGSFLGQTLEITTGGRFRNGQAEATVDTVRNLTLSGGTIDHISNLAWNLSLAGNTLTLNGGTLQSGTGSRNISIRNAVLAGSGNVSVTAGANTSSFEFQSTVTTVGFTGIFSVSSNGRLHLPQITPANESFELDIADGTGALQNDVSIAVTVLKLWNATASTLDTIAPGVYTANGLGSTYSTCFTLPADTTKTIQVGRGLAYDANGGSGAPATTYWANGGTATAAVAGGMTRPGYSFTGWNTQANGLGTSIAAGGTFTISTETTLYAQWLGSGSIIVASTLPSALTTVQGVASGSVNVSVTSTGLSDPITAGPSTGLEFANDDATWGTTTTLPSTGGTLYARLAAAAAAGSYDAVSIPLASGFISATTATTSSGNTVSNDYWISTSSGDWGTSGNWQSGAVANGSGNTADFNQVDLTADTTVHLDAARTIGNLSFGDTDASTAAGWTLDNNGSAGNTLTLAGTSPTITVTSLDATKSVTISAIIAGLSLAKQGTNALILSGANTYTGGTVVSAGSLTLQNDQSAANGGYVVRDTVGAANAPTLDIAAGSTVVVASGKTIQVGALNTSGKYGSMNVSGAVNNSGTLTIGRPGILNLDNSGSWLQSGDLTMQAYGNHPVGNATLNVNAGSTFTYTGGNLIQVNGNSGGANNGRSYLNIYGLFVTGVGFQQANGISAGFGQVTLDGGTLRLSADVADLFTSSLAGSIKCAVSNSAAIDTDGHSCTVSIGISGSGGALTKIGSGTLTLTAANTYTGNTTINGGTLALADNAQLRFVIGANGVNNKVTGNGTATLDGDFNLDLSGADTTVGNSWLLLDVATLSETFGATFTVLTFTETSPGVWKKQIDATKRYVFSVATGVLSVQANNAPVAKAISLGARTGVLTSLQIIGGKYNPTDADGDTVTLQSVTYTGGNGATVVFSGGSINYTAASSFSGTDTFDYTVSDGSGGTDTKTVTVTVTSANAGSFNIVSGPTLANGNFVVRFAGVPGTAYTVETNGVVGPGWAKFGNYTAPTESDPHPNGVGIFEVTKPNEGEGSLYFRTVHPSY